MAEIVLENVTKTYADGTHAVSSVDLSVPDGKLVVLVGPSGCGKTTLLRMVAGLESVTDGTIRIGDRLVNKVPAKKRDIAMVFQNYALYPHLTAYDNMAFSLRLQRAAKAKIESRVLGAASALGLGGVLGKKPRHLSGGQRQRVAMGRAIVREPQAFLMDEPLSNLDAKLRVQMRAEIARIQRDLGATTLYVTHDQTEALTLGHLVAVMRHGVIEQIDSPEVLFERPRNLFVAGFIGSPAMNLVEATIVRLGDSVVAEFGGRHRIRMSEEVLARIPALGGYAGRRLILGIRPEDVEDASLTPDAPRDARLALTVDLREIMGREVYLHSTIDSPPVLTEDTEELAADTEAVALDALRQQASERRSTFVARVSSSSRANEGATVDLAVHLAALNFFDPKTGVNIHETGAA